jgi:hypothetical protein
VRKDSHAACSFGYDGIEQAKVASDFIVSQDETGYL